MTLIFQLYGLLKSNYIIMKRNRCLTFIEIFTPTLLLLFFFILNLFFSKEKEKYEFLYKNDAEFLFQYSSNLTNSVKNESQIITNITEATNSTPIQYTKFLSQCKKHPHVALIGINFTPEIKNKISTHFWELPDLTHEEKENFFKYFDTVDEFNEYITSKDYGKDEIIHPKICFGISKDKDKKYGFGIHYDTFDKIKAENIYLNDTPKIPDFKISKNEKIKTQTDLQSFQLYKFSGYLMVMKIIYDYILQKATYNSNAEVDFSIVEMIYDPIMKDKFHEYLYLLGFFIIISYAIILSINIFREINLRETKKKEYLKCMGLKEKIFFFSSFIRSFTINIIHSSFTALIIKCILTKSQYLYLLLILFLYGLNIFSMTYFFQSFQQKSRKGVIMSLLCYCIMSFLYVPIDSPIIDKNIINLFCILFPPLNLMLGLDVLITFQKEFHYFDNIKSDVGQISIFEMLIFFTLSFFIYLFVGYIFTKCFHHDNGSSKCCRNKIKKELIKQKEEIKIKELISNTDINSQNKEDENIGEEYNGEDFSGDSFKQIKPNANKEIKIMAHDIMNTPGNMTSYRKKIQNLSTRIKQGKTDVQFLDISNDSNNSSNKVFIDELEKNFKIQKERQEIRKMRRTLGKTMSNLKEEEFFVNNLDISIIQEVIPDDIMSNKEIESFISDNSSSNVDNLQRGEFNKKKDEINPGQRLEVKKLEKYYNNGKKIVLNELDCTMYENEIFALLGENGAGKSTFISIIGGLIEANGGKIIYKNDIDDTGYNILKRKGNYQFRKILGICPQNNNILFNDLTVKENLEIFCLLKYSNSIIKAKEEIDKEVKYLLKKFDLSEDKIVNCLAKNLSGGQKRKLCIAIACCGKSRVIILDEPTGGIDVSSKKNIWKILKALKLEEKIIILISHSMEEVSYLADKIGILEKGKLILQGTSRELIDNYGQYFSLIINQKLEYETAKDISSYIAKNYYYEKEISNNNISDITTKKTESTSNTINYRNIKLEVFKERVIIKISNKYFKKDKSAQLFENLKEKYNIKNYLVIEDQLEDVFINKINNNKGNKDLLASNKTKYMVILSSNENKKKYKNFEKFKNELNVSFFKNLKNLKGIQIIISDILFPFILILIACLVSYFEFLEENNSSEIYLINLNDEYQNIYAENLVDNGINDNNYVKIQNIIREEKEKLKNYEFHLINHSEEDIKTYTLTEKILYYMKVINTEKKEGNFTKNYADFLFTKFDNVTHKYEFVAFVDTKRKHYPIFFSNYLLNFIIKYGFKTENSYNRDYSYEEFTRDISVSNSPFPLKYEEKYNKKSRKGFSLVFYISIAFALIPSNIITSIIREKENKLKHLQILSGLSLFTYWLNNYIFDLLKYIVISLLSYLILIFFHFEENYLPILYFLYGPAMISFTYCVSYFIDKEGPGQTIALLINLLFGTLGSSAIFILRTNEDAKRLGKILSYCFRIIPSFCLSFGYNELISKNILYAIDQHEDEIDNPNYIFNYVKDDIIFLAIEIIVYTGILIILEKKDYLIWRYFRKYCKKKHSENEEIKENTKQIEKYINNKNDPYTDEPLSVKNKKNKSLVSVSNIKKILQFRLNCFKLCKKKSKIILDDLSFDVENGECFGLIGTNGAGKTTCFRCLCKELEPDKGSIKINNCDIFDYTSKYKPSIGYCPQFDSIFEYLTVRENIHFFGRLKGFTEHNLNTLANSIMKCLDLCEFGDVVCENLSGGNKRKLSVGISILAKPDVIFLDEPSTGMDPYTRRLLLNLLNYGYLKNKNNGKVEETKKKGIILTTHSLEEIEALCDRIGILIDGKMNKDRIGTINSIINRNKREIILNIEFKKPSIKQLTKNYEKICEERIKNIKEIKNFLDFLNKMDYKEYIDENSLGRDLIYILKANKSINKYTVLIWVKYMDYLKNLVKKLKENNFNEITCVAFNINNFVLSIKNDYKGNECDSSIFPIMESNKETLFIEEYSYTLTTFEKIFSEFCKEAYQKEGKIQEPFDIESENNSKFKVDL